MVIFGPCMVVFGELAYPIILVILVLVESAALSIQP